MAREVSLHERAGHDRGEVFGRVHRLKNRLTEPLQIGSLIPGALLIHLTHCISMMSRTDTRLRQLTKPSVKVDNLQSHTQSWLRVHLLMAGECRVGTEVGVANSAEGLSHRSRRRFVE